MNIKVANLNIMTSFIVFDNIDEYMIISWKIIQKHNLMERRCKECELVENQELFNDYKRDICFDIGEAITSDSIVKEIHNLCLKYKSLFTDESTELLLDYEHQIELKDNETTFKKANYRRYQKEYIYILRAKTGFLPVFAHFLDFHGSNN